MNNLTDRVGLGWRPDLAAGILEHLDGIDLLEVIADDFFSAPSRQIRALKTLAAQIPVVLHGVSLGLASSSPVVTKRLGQMARLVEEVSPEFWSEHLAFVRAGGIEIGHLAAPPRCSATVDAAAANLHRAQAAVGAKPLVENIATLIDPPASTLSESDWITGILSSSNCGLLLDLHNVLANGLNHGYDPCEFVRQIPPERIAAIHIAGGKFISAPDGTERLLDDHLHDVPDPVFDLLEETAARAPRSAHSDSRTRRRLSLDGLPSRANRPSSPSPRQRPRAPHATCGGRRLSSTRLEAFLARLYVDSDARANFKGNPRAEAKKAGLSDEQCTALENFDWIGLEMAARNFAKKRQLKRRPSWFAAFLLRLSRLRFPPFLQ